MCDCRLVSVYVRSHTYSQCVCLYGCVCECVLHCVFASQCAQPVRQPLSIDYVWCSAAACGCHHSTLPCPAHTCSTFPSPAAYTCTSVTFAT